MNIEGNVIVKPHILKFICWLEHIKVGERLRLGKGIVSRTLRLLLKYKTATKNYNYELSSDYSAVLPFYLPKRAWDRGKMFLGKSDIIEFNGQMHALFHDILLLRIIQYKMLGKTEKEAIIDFLVLLDAEEDVHWDSIKRVNSRLRKHKKMPTFYDKNVLAI